MKNFTYWCDHCLEFIDFSEEDTVFVCPQCNKILKYIETEEIDPVSGLVVNKYQESARQKANPGTKVKMVNVLQQPTVECPYCHSTNTKKISGTTRFVSTGLFGLASNKIGKNFHCNNCKSDF